MAPAGHPSFGSRTVGRSARRLRSRGWRSISDVLDAIARCMRCRAHVEDPHELFLALGTGVLDEAEQCGVGVGGVGPVAERSAEVVEVRLVEGRADLVDALEVVRDPAQRDGW